MNHGKVDNGTVRAVERALDILNAFEDGGVELSATELLAKVQLPRGTLYRLLHTLERHKFLTGSGEPRRFGVGPSLLQLSKSPRASRGLLDVARPILQRIWDATQETVAMFLLEPPLRRCVAELASPQPLMFKRGVGYTECLGRGAGGRAILAQMPLALAELETHARNAAIGLQTMQKLLATTRALGYARSSGEIIPGTATVAAAFYGRDGQVSGSVAVFGPEVRLGDSKIKDIASLLAAQAALLSDMLSSRPTP